MVEFAVALAAAFVAAAASFPARAAPRAARTTALAAAGGLNLASPLFAPPTQPPLRTALEPMARPELAPTSAEFWRRWNRPAQQFFYEDVFKPCGGLRAPVRGALASLSVRRQWRAAPAAAPSGVQ
jgi:hypothetical protein